MGAVDERDLALRRAIFDSFATTGSPPASPEGDVRALADRHVVVLDDDGEILMAHPFATHHEGARVDADGRTWWGNCAWDALGILGALHADGRIESECPDCGERLELEVRDGELVAGRELLVHFVVPARRWWDDIGFT